MCRCCDPLRFRVLSVERFADVVMVDETDIRLIDAHAKGVSGDNHFGIAGHEPILNRVPLRGFETAVVEERVDAQRT